MTVIQYCLDIYQTFIELSRVTKNNARIIFVVGRESTVCGTKFNNGELVSAVSELALFNKLILRQERNFMNRFGKNIIEDILHFQVISKYCNNNNIENVRQLAKYYLKKSLKHAPEKSKNDIYLAIDKINDVEPSPIFQPNILTGV